MNFQAGDIQKMVGITKSRYEYLRSKIGINPEVMQVEGTGHTNLFSFRNLLDFAFAHHASRIGLAPLTVKRLLAFLFSNHNLKEMGLYAPDKKNDVLLHYIFNGDFSFYQLLGGDCDKQLSRSCFPLEGFDNLIGMARKCSSGVKIPVKDILAMQKMIKDGSRESADGYITVNIGRIKEQIRKQV